MAERVPSSGTPTPGKSPSDDKSKANNDNKGRGFRRGSAQPKFEGKTEALKGHVYVYGDSRQSDMYTQTTKEIAEYVGRTLSYGNDIANAITNLRLPTIVEPPEPVPTPPATTLSKAQDKIFEKQIVEYCKRIAQLEENVKKVFAIVWGQCSEALREKLRALPNFTQMQSDGDGLGLLKEIQDIAFKRERGKDPWHAYFEATLQLFLFRQGDNMSLQHYFEKFQNLCDVVDHCGGGLGNVRELQQEMLTKIAADPKSPTMAEILLAKNKSRDRFYATMFFLRADRNRYGPLQKAIYNEKAQGQDRYPESLIEAYDRLATWQPEYGSGHPRGGITSDGVAFANVGKKGKTTPDKSKVTCFNCGKLGHYSNECDAPAKNNEDDDQQNGVNMFNAGVSDADLDFDDFDESGFTFSTISYHSVLCELNSDGRVSENWILLDNQSTVDVFYNKKLLRNVRRSKAGMEIHCNAGKTTTHMIGELPGYGTVWYHPEGIANILSLSRVSKKYRVTFDSSNGNEFTIHKEDGSFHRFKQSARGLYFMDTTKKATTLITTVDDKKSKYTNRDYSAALSARRLQNILGFPSTRSYIKIVENKLLRPNLGE
jgi:Zinc knuckle